MILIRARQFFHSKFVQDTLILQIGKIAVTLLGLISTVLVTRLMGPHFYGIYALTDSFYNIWKTLDLTGVTASTSTRLGIAIGAGNEREIENLMAFYVQITMITTVGLALLLAVFGASVAQSVHGDASIGTMAALLAITGPGDAFYGLVVIALQSHRAFRALALLQNANQFILTASMIAAVLINPAPISLIFARLFFSYLTMLIALIAYANLRKHGEILPSLHSIIRRVPHLSPRPYLRFGFANALDKNVANLYIEIPRQIIGILGGERAVGYVSLALRGLAQISILTSAVFENMQAVVPQLVGRGDYGRLWRNFIRVFAVLTFGGLVFYGLLALLAPVLIAPIFGDEWTPVIPVLLPLTLYGAITTVGGIFGPLYRAFGIMRAALGVKLLALAVALPTGIALMIQGSVNTEPFWGWGYVSIGSTAVAVGGAWTINLLYIVSTLLTMAITLPLLRRKAQQKVMSDE
jgi:O-antigen/teichoic acid export membrane protein